MESRYCPVPLTDLDLFMSPQPATPLYLRYATQPRPASGEDQGAATPTLGRLACPSH